MKTQSRLDQMAEQESRPLNVVGSWLMTIVCGVALFYAMFWYWL